MFEPQTSTESIRSLMSLGWFQPSKPVRSTHDLRDQDGSNLANLLHQSVVYYDSVQWCMLFFFTKTLIIHCGSVRSYFMDPPQAQSFVPARFPAVACLVAHLIAWLSSL